MKIRVRQLMKLYFRFSATGTMPNHLLAEKISKIIYLKQGSLERKFDYGLQK